MLKNIRSKRRAFAANPSLTHGRELLLTVGPAAVLVIAAVLLAMRFMPPPPPKVVAISTGGEAGAYFAFGKRYADVLKRSGVTLEVRPSAGSIENIKRLKDANSGIAAALLQGGIGNSQELPDVVSIGRVFQEPLWVFYRGATAERLSDFKGKRIAVGTEGSGTRVLAEALLTASQIGATSATLLPISGQAAVDALKKGEADAIFLALAPQAPIIQTLVRDIDVRLMNFAQADAYTKVFPYLARLTLPQGVFDLERNIPERDVALIAPQAAIVVRNDLHPAVVALLAEAAQEVHGKSSLFARAGEFPTLSDPEFEMDSDALRYYKAGPTFWKRVLPYWLANMVERAIVFLVPLLTLLIPLVKIAPALYKWRIRQRIQHWYRKLVDLEERVADLPAGASWTALMSELESFDDAISALPVPVNFVEQVYNLRTHVELVRQRLAARPPEAGAMQAGA